MLAALGPGVTVGEVEGVRRMLRFMMDALPVPLDPSDAGTAAEGDEADLAAKEGKA